LFQIRSLKTNAYSYAFVIVTVLSISMISGAVLRSYFSVTRKNQRAVAKEELLVYLIEDQYLLKNNPIKIIQTNVHSNVINNQILKTRHLKSAANENALWKLPDEDTVGYIDFEDFKVDFSTTDLKKYLIVRTVVYNRGNLTVEAYAVFKKKHNKYHRVKYLIKGY